jgi:hypothetical protein
MRHRRPVTAGLRWNGFGFRVGPSFSHIVGFTSRSGSKTLVASGAVAVKYLPERLPGAFGVSGGDPGGGRRGSGPCDRRCQWAVFGGRQRRQRRPGRRSQHPDHQQGGGIAAGVPGTEHPDCERAGDPRPLGPPGHRHALPDLRPSHQRARLPRPPRPREITGGRQAGCTGMYARLSGSRQAGTRDRRGPSVAVRGKPTVHTDRPGGRTPSAYLHRHVTASGSVMGRFPFRGVLRCAPLP